MGSTTIFFSNTGGLFASDIFILIALFVIFFAYALYFGKNQIISLILAFYPAQFFYENFPFLNSLIFLKGNLLLLNKVLIFLVFLVVMDILIGRYVFKDSGYGSGHYFRIAGYALAMVAIVLIFSYSVISLNTVHTFSAMIGNLFATPDRIFFWNLAPLALLFVL